MALWANTDTGGKAKLQGGMLDAGNRLTLEEWTGGDRLWLVDLIPPFATAENRHREIMIGDLVAGPLRRRAFKFHVTDPSGVRAVRSFDADTGDQLTELVKGAMRAQSH